MDAVFHLKNQNELLAGVQTFQEGDFMAATKPKNAMQHSDPLFFDKTVQKKHLHVINRRPQTQPVSLAQSFVNAPRSYCYHKSKLY